MGGVYQRWVSMTGHDIYNDVIMDAIASQITSLTIVYSTVYSGADQRKHERSASLAFVRGIHRGPVNSPHKWPVTGKMFPFVDVITVCMGTILTMMFRPTEITIAMIEKKRVVLGLIWRKASEMYFNQVRNSTEILSIKRILTWEGLPHL